MGKEMQLWYVSVETQYPVWEDKTLTKRKSFKRRLNAKLYCWAVNFFTNSEAHIYCTQKMEIIDD